jgi:hypothetical protein
MGRNFASHFTLPNMAATRFPPRASEARRAVSAQQPLPVAFALPTDGCAPLAATSLDGQRALLALRSGDAAVAVFEGAELRV